MSFDRIVEAIIKEAMEHGEFDNLSGKGKPMDLTAYFDTPEEDRVAYSILQNAGIMPPRSRIAQRNRGAKANGVHFGGWKEAVRTPQRDRKRNRSKFSLMMERNHKKK